MLAFLRVLPRFRHSQFHASPALISCPKCRTARFLVFILAYLGLSLPGYANAQGGMTTAPPDPNDRSCQARAWRLYPGGGSGSRTEPMHRPGKPQEGLGLG